ncbi:MAG: PepSY domain-containing protein, partial [bacterium]
ADRTSRIVTLDARTGKVAKAEPQVNKPPKKGDKKKPADDAPPPVVGTISLNGRTPAEFPYLAEVSLDEAIAAANATYPGWITEVYLYASGGTLLYGIEIAGKAGGITLVQLDAGNGAILGTLKM